jgi:hypothetical protein
MNKHEQIERRFQELTLEAQKMPMRRDGSITWVDIGAWHQWASSVMSLLEAVFGSTSAHPRNFSIAYQKFIGYDADFHRANGIFNAAKADFLGGYIFHLEQSISGEVLGNLVMLAKMALDEGHKDVAAVLACAALEDSLKRYAAMNDLDVQQKSMSEVVGALKGKGLVSGATKTLLDTMPKLRDYAMHANWGKLSLVDVAGIIGFVEQFLLSHFK